MRKQKAIMIGSYATLVLIGGIIGYVVAHSMISLIASTLCALLLLTCSFFIWQDSETAYRIALMLVLSLFLFFGYRFLLTYKLMPAGIMTLISVSLLSYLFVERKQVDF